MRPIVTFKNFTFTYRNVTEPTLKNINLIIEKGELVLIAGPSGSGKSTLAHCLNGLIPFSYEGQIEGELRVKDYKPYEKSIFDSSQSVGTVLQDQDAQFIGLSVGEDVAFFLENEAWPQKQMKAKVNEALMRVDMLEKINHSPHECSGGQKQRVSLAGILTTQADILLFDEPLANLDPASGIRAMQLIRELRQHSNKTIIIIEHRIEDVLELGVDKMVVMDQGEIKCVGTPDELLKQGAITQYGMREPLYLEALHKVGLSLANIPFPSRIESFANDSFRKPLQRWFETHKNGKVGSYPPVHESSKNDQGFLLELCNISFSYDGITNVLQDVSCAVREGEILSLLGNNGAGKSTLSHIITGILKPSTGHVYLQGQPFTSLSINERGKMIGYVMQNPNHMITQHMLWDEVSLGLKSLELNAKEIKGRVERVLRICGLYPYRNWPISALSYGQKKRVTIASILVMNPKLIILDEPTAGQDFKHYTEFMSFIKGLSQEGMAFLFITHDMNLALEYSERAIVLADGVKIADDHVAKVLTNSEIMNKANLKYTSIAKLAKLLQLEPVDQFVQFILAGQQGE